MFLSFLEACVFGFLAALHFGVTAKIGPETFSASFLYPAAIVDTCLALALLLSVVVPGDGAVRAGRVMAAQILVLIGLFAVHVALLRGPAFDVRTEVFYGVALVLSLASIALVASPAMRRRPLAR